MNKIRIIEASNALGLGGTEYVIQLYSKYLDKENFEVTVIGLNEGGVRAELIQNMGIKVIILNGDLNRLAELLQKTDVFHWHGDGSLSPELFHVVKVNRPKLVIQTNVFGIYDHSVLYNVIDYDLYVSKMILIRRMILDRDLEDNFTSKRRVLPNPVDVEHMNSLMPSDERVQKFKEAHDLQGQFIIGRIGRADNTKFDLITLDGFAAFAKKASNVRFLLIGATPEILSHANVLHIMDKLIVIENTPDLEQLLIYYKAMDIFLAASYLGESFGLVIAEAMAAGIPVVTISTPYRDNAQVELVDNGKTGLVVERNTEKIASAIMSLYEDQNKRAVFSESSKIKVTKEYKANKVVRSLENLIYNHFNLPVNKHAESLIVDFSQEILDDYTHRFSDLWEPNVEAKI